MAVSNTALECDGILSDFASLSICQHGLCWPSNIGQREQAGKESGKPDGKETRWQGTIVRIDKEKSTMSIRGGQSNMSGMERQVSYDSSTHWTKQGKPVEQSEFKEGWFVIVLGHADEKGNLHASRIDLRLPRSLYRRLGTALYQHTDAALPLPLSQGHRDVVDLCQRKQGIGQTEI